MSIGIVFFELNQPISGDAGRHTAVIESLKKGQFRESNNLKSEEVSLIKNLINSNPDPMIRSSERIKALTKASNWIRQRQNAGNNRVIN